MIPPLVAYNDPILHKVCRADFVLDTFIIDQMFNEIVLRKALGLAAPQIGIDARFFVTRWGEVFFNPQIALKEIPCTVDEGCLSLPGVNRAMQRFNRITLLDGRVYTERRAVVIQHELDHLNGILITDDDALRYGRAYEGQEG